MAIEVVLPRLGWNMETGRVGEWLKRDGERVEAGQLLFTVEGDKATQEVEALDSGILSIPPDAPPPGKEVPVGTVLAYLLQPGEVATSRSKTEDKKPSPDETEGPLAATGARSKAADTNKALPTISPRARRVARELGVDWSGVKGSGRTGRIVERDVRQAARLLPQASPLAAERISPLARRLAAELRVDVDALAAAMPGRRIERADVETAARALPQAPLPGRLMPISTVRRVIGERMAGSAHTAAPVTLTTEVDATELVQLRKQLKEDGSQPVPAYNDLLAKLVAQALLEHPAINARFEGDAILQAETANIGLAVDTDRGLLVPVLRDVQAKSVRQIAAEAADLIEKTRAGRISPDDLTGGTFTITNLGMYEIDAFTPIINLPECAILGAGRIVAKQVVMDPEGQKVAIRHMLFLSLTFDHRLVDGAPAARFLQRVKQYVEKPYLWLVG